MTWVVTLRYNLAEIDQAALISWEDRLVDIDATTGRIPGVAATLTVYIEADDPVAAVQAAASVVRPVTEVAPIAVEAIDEQAYLDGADEPNLPDLVSAAEVADQLQISRQRVHQLQSTAGFPEPLYRLRTGPVWDARAIEAFATRWDRRPGRRAAEAEPRRTAAVRKSATSRTPAADLAAGAATVMAARGRASAGGRQVRRRARKS